MSAPIIRSGAKVVEFVDKYDIEQRKAKEERKNARSKKRSRQTSSTPDGTAASSREVAQEFEETMNDVLEFGVAGLGKRQRKEHERRKLVKLGCKVDSEPKMPYRILQSMRKTHLQREDKRRKDLKQSKVVVAKMGNGTSFTGARFAAADSKTKPKRRKREVDIHSTDVGRLRNGVMHLNKSSM